jgi:hypothetical protein
MIRIGSIPIDATPLAPGDPPIGGDVLNPVPDDNAWPPLTNGNIFSIDKRLAVIRANLGVYNDHEPLSSDETPSPLNANFYKGDDYIYHRVNLRWKRTNLKHFNESV